jgi:hypothetical protein
MSAINTQDVLLARGLMQAADDANWQPHSYHGSAGWRYPVYNFKGEQFTINGERVYRWKNTDSNGDPKYSWIPGKPDKARYYLLPGALEAIKAEYGACFLASGEPDVLAYRAAGRCNVTCWFDGEASIPATLADDLALMGVSMLTYAPDRDDTGMKSAAGVFNALKDSEIALRVLKLPAEMGSKFDINKLWQQVNFNTEKFGLALVDAPDIDPVDLYLYGEGDTGLTHGADMSFSDDVELPGKFKDDMIRYVEGLPGFKRWDADGWANFKCPLHDDKHVSAGYNRESHGFKCFVCGKKSAKEFGASANINLRDYFDKPVPKERQQPLLSSNGAKPEPPTAPEVPLYRDSYDVTLELIAELEGKRLPDSEPMIFPFTILHQFEGFAEIMWPGKLVYISGISGGGKTSYGEFMYETMNRNGDDCVWFGPEWDAPQMKMRALQRDGGLNMSAIGKLRLYHLDERAGVPEPDRRGAYIADGAVQESISKLRNMLSWPGRTYYLTPDKRHNSMAAILDTIEAIVTVKRGAGRRVRTLFFDYLQRAPKVGVRGWDWQEMVVSQVKDLCERLELVGVVFIQPTKGESKKTRDGETLTEASGQGISDQQCNLYLTITPAFHVDGTKLDYARVKVVKNSLGRTDDLFQAWNANRLLWFDREVTLKTVNLNEVVFGEGE